VDVATEVVENPAKGNLWRFQGCTSQPDSAARVVPGRQRGLRIRHFRRWGETVPAVRWARQIEGAPNGEAKKECEREARVLLHALGGKATTVLEKL
jgi:hypothetical protein